jgi:ribosomal L6-like protein
MSRVGKKPVAVPSGVTASVDGQVVNVKGPKGTLSLVLHGDVAAKVEGAEIKVDPRVDTQRARAMWGTYRSLLANVMTGVTKGFERRLEITGVGYRAALQGKNLQVQLGYSHDTGGHHDRGAQAHRGRRHRHRRPEGRARRRRNPFLPQAGAVQRQGREIRGRIHLPQGRQEEVMGAHDGDSY